MSQDLFAAVAQAEGWELCSAPLGYGEWLMAATPHETLAIVPPAVPASADEKPDERQEWRLLSWSGDIDDSDLSNGTPREVALIDLVGHLPETQHVWVVAACERQLKQLDLWVRRDVGPNHEARARAADQRRARMVAELQLTFPSQTWQAPPAAVPEIPNTAAALLHEIDAPTTSRADDVWARLEQFLREWFYRLIWLYRQLVVAARAARSYVRESRQQHHAGAVAHTVSEHNPGTEEHHIVGQR